MCSLERLCVVYHVVIDWFSCLRAQAYADAIQLLVPHYQLARSSCRIQCVWAALRVVRHAPVSLQIKVRMVRRAVLNTHVTVPPSSRAKPHADRHNMQQPATPQAGRTLATQAMKRHERVRATSQQVVDGIYKTPVDQLLTCDLSAAAYSVRIVPLAAELARGQ